MGKSTISILIIFQSMFWCSTLISLASYASVCGFRNGAAAQIVCCTVSTHPAKTPVENILTWLCPWIDFWENVEKPIGFFSSNVFLCFSVSAVSLPLHQWVFRWLLMPRHVRPRSERSGPPVGHPASWGRKRDFTHENWQKWGALANNKTRTTRVMEKWCLLPNLYMSSGQNYMLDLMPCTN